MITKPKTTWRTVRLGDVADLQWGDTDTTKAAYKLAGYIAFSATGPDGFMDHYDFDRDGVVLSAIGANCGETWFARDKWSCIKNTIRFWGEDGKADTRFLYYKTHNKNLWPQRGSAQPFISQTDARNLELDIPEGIAEQKRIAEILSAFDEKIENNNRTIKALEEMAQAIFKEWFVNFRFPGHEKADFVDSPLGRIPKGWEESNLFNVLSVTYGYPFKSSLFKEDKKGMPVIRIRNILEGQTPTYTTETVDEKYIVNDGDILVGMDGQFHLRMWSSGQALLNQRVVRFRPKSGKGWFYAYLALEVPIRQKESSAVGTTVAHLSDKDLKSIFFIVPAKNLADEFNDLTDSYYLQVVGLLKENQKIAAMRDLLLPRLMSGEIRV